MKAKELLKRLYLQLHLFKWNNFYLQYEDIKYLCIFPKVAFKENFIILTLFIADDGLTLFVRNEKKKCKQI